MGNQPTKHNERALEEPEISASNYKTQINFEKDGVVSGIEWVSHFFSSFWQKGNGNGNGYSMGELVHFAIAQEKKRKTASWWWEVCLNQKQ